MERIELVELVREKAGVGYTDAKEALDASGDDLLDALVWLEAQGRSQTRSAYVTTGVPAGGAGGISGEMYTAQSDYARSSQSGLRALGRWLGGVRDAIARAVRRGMDTKVVSRRGGERPLTLPLLGTVLGMMDWLMLALLSRYWVLGLLGVVIVATPVAAFFYLVFACRIERPAGEKDERQAAVPHGVAPVRPVPPAPAGAVPPRPIVTSPAAEPPVAAGGSEPEGDAAEQDAPDDPAPDSPADPDRGPDPQPDGADAAREEEPNHD